MVTDSTFNVRLIYSWPPSLGEALEIAQEITEDIDSELLENEFTLSLDKGLDRIVCTESVSKIFG